MHELLMFADKTPEQFLGIEIDMEFCKLPDQVKTLNKWDITNKTKIKQNQDSKKRWGQKKLSCIRETKIHATRH